MRFAVDVPTSTTTCRQRLSFARFAVIFCCLVTLQTLLDSHQQTANIDLTDDYAMDGPLFMTGGDIIGDDDYNSLDAPRRAYHDPPPLNLSLEELSATTPEKETHEEFLAEMVQLQHVMPPFRFGPSSSLSSSLLLPPVYWINLDSSVDRRNAMKNMFQDLGIPLEQTYRISAVNVEQTKALWNSTKLLLYRDFKLHDQDGKPSYLKHAKNIYEYPETACLLSHLQAIKQAYQHGHDLVLVLEDDALLSDMFVRHWNSYLQQAPSEWKILQFATNNRVVVQQGANLLDYFMAWQPYHWSTRAYMIRREGMERILNATLGVNGTVWDISSAPVVVADETLYYLAKDAYTSAGLYVDAASGFSSTIQSANAHSNLTAIIGTGGSTNLAIKVGTKQQNQQPFYSSSILILMNVRLKSLKEMENELRWLYEDNDAVCPLHSTCEWDVSVVMADPKLEEPFRRATIAFPKSIRFHVRIFLEAFNKFAYLKTLVPRLQNYDRILFKDNDQRLTGFPWRTFCNRSDNAIVSGPLRQSVDEALLSHHQENKRQYFQFHAAEAWTEDWVTQWSARYFTDVVPIEVPMLEMYFVLMDGKFAHWFFDRILTPHFCNQTSAWGPDLMWCPAAKQWDPERPSCLLIPVVSTHEDTRQIVKNASTGHHNAGFAMVEKFKENPEFEGWMRVASNWTKLIGGKRLHQIEQYCRLAVGLQTKLVVEEMIPIPFDLPACAEKMYNLEGDQVALAAITAAGNAQSSNHRGTATNRYGRRAKAMAYQGLEKKSGRSFADQVVLVVVLYFLGMASFLLRRVDPTPTRTGPNGPARPPTIQDRWF